MTFVEEYLTFGWSLIPILPETKKPAQPWTEFQTRRASLSEVQDWLARGWWLAVVTGEVSGVVVIDDDRAKHGLNEWGFTSPLIAKTQSGGKHFYFKYDQEIHGHVNTKLHLDLRAWHNYCLLPPFNGREWLVDPTEGVQKLGPVPDEIVRLINTDKLERERSREPLKMADFVDISDGARTESLHRIACSVFNHMEKDDAVRLLAGVNQTYSPPLGGSEFEYQVSRAWQFVKDHPKQKEVIAPNQEKLIVKTGISSLDDILRGFHSGGAYIVGGEEKSGKTSLILNFIKNFVEFGHRVFYASTELKEDDLQDYLDSISGQPGWRSPNFHFSDLGEAGTLAEHLKIVESELASRTRIVVVDNLTSYRDHSDLGRDEWMRIAQAGDAYRRLAKKWNAVILMVVHLNQGTRLNEIPQSVKKFLQKGQPEEIFEESISVYRRPTKDDIKGGSGYRSQTLGQILLWRPYQGFYSPDLNKLCSVIVENNRHGPTGEVRLAFDGATKKFDEPLDF